jgi:hypothetical protein
MPSCSRESQRHLEAIVNQPLKCRQRTNHQNPNRQSIPQSRKPNIAINPAHRLPRTFSRFPIRIELRDHDICRVRDHSASNTRNVTAEEGHTGLLQPIVGGFRLTERGVDLVDCCLEGGELAHGVRDLAAPERIQSFIQSTPPSAPLYLSNPSSGVKGDSPSISFVRDNLRDAFSHRVCKRRQRGLHPYLDSLKRAQRNIREELRTGTRAQKYDRLAHAREHLLAIQVFEYFVEAVFSAALQAVPDERW